MKLQNLVLIGLLLLGSVATVAAQNSLPNPNDDSCWSSVAALRACQLKVYNEEQDYAQRCTSYPEYQCNNYYQPQPKASAKSIAKAKPAAASTTPAAAAHPSVTSYADVQTSSAN